MACTFLGLADLVDCVLLDSSCSQFHIAGFSRLAIGDTKLYAFVAGVSGVFADAVLWELLQDDRLATRLPVILDAIDVEMRWLDTLSDEFFDWGSSLVGHPAAVLRSLCLHSAHVTVSYCWAKFLGPASRYPWSLCRGDVETNPNNQYNRGVMDFGFKP